MLPPLNDLADSVRRDVSDICGPLLKGIQGILGAELVGLYLEGSLALGDLDEASDLDFVAVVERPIDEAAFAALQRLHDELHHLPVRFAMDLEGTYADREVVRRFRPTSARVPNLERGRGERLKWSPVWASWIVHLSILREQGIALYGPPPAELVDPISVDELRQTVAPILLEWGGAFLAKPDLAAQPGYQPYAVLSICRMLYTLHHGAVTSKRKAAHWASAALGVTWRSLIEAAWAERRRDPLPVAPERVEPTIEFVRMAMARATLTP